MSRGGKGRARLGSPPGDGDGRRVRPGWPVSRGRGLVSAAGGVLRGLILPLAVAGCSQWSSPPVRLDTPASDRAFAGADYTVLLADRPGRRPGVRVELPAGASVDRQGYLVYEVPAAASGTFTVRLRAQTRTGFEVREWPVAIVEPARNGFDSAAELGRDFRDSGNDRSSRKAEIGISVIGSRLSIKLPRAQPEPFDHGCGFDRTPRWLRLRAATGAYALETTVRWAGAPPTGDGGYHAGLALDGGHQQLEVFGLRDGGVGYFASCPPEGENPQPVLLDFDGDGRGDVLGADQAVDLRVEAGAGERVFLARPAGRTRWTEIARRPEPRLRPIGLGLAVASAGSQGAFEVLFDRFEYDTPGVRQLAVEGGVSVAPGAIYRARARARGVGVRYDVADAPQGLVIDQVTGEIALAIPPEAPAGTTFKWQVQAKAGLYVELVDWVTKVVPGAPPPPTTLTMGTFTLEQVSYEKWQWDPSAGVYFGAAGTATTTLGCNGQTRKIPVTFPGLVVVPQASPGHGKVLVGSAFYLVSLAAYFQPQVEFAVDGFGVLLNEIELGPVLAFASMRLRLPPGLIDPATSRPPVLDLGQLSVDAAKACEFRFKAYTPQPYGPWIVGDTGMVIAGVGLDVDFRTDWGVPPRPPAWRGVVLEQGATQPATGTVISNSGYLLAPYIFGQAEVVGGGFGGFLLLSSPFSFETLAPLGYGIDLAGGLLELKSSDIVGGNFPGCKITLPGAAVTDADNKQVTASCTLAVKSNRDLVGDVAIPVGSAGPGGLPAGLYLHAPGGDPKQTYAVIATPGASFAGLAYFAAEHFGPYLPLAPLPQNPTPNDIETQALSEPFSGVTSPTDPKIPKLLVQSRIQGVTTFFAAAAGEETRLLVFSPDVPPAATPIEITTVLSWANIAARGVHGTVEAYADELRLGPIKGAYYRADHQLKKRPFLTEHADFAIRFVDSAVFATEGQILVILPVPINALLPIRDPGLTSTAQLPGAPIVLDEPLTLDHWQLQLVGKPNASSAGVVSFKTGQALLSAAGIQEKRHFAEPFWLTWGEIFPGGDWGEMAFDYHSDGQDFDGFPFVHEAVLLSPYDPLKPDKTNSYLQVAGHAHFALFGGTYLNILDRYTGSAGHPYYNRFVELSDTPIQEQEMQIQGTQRALYARWADVGEFDYPAPDPAPGSAKSGLAYDEAGQYGFTAEGHVKIDSIHAATGIAGGEPLESTATLRPGRTCFSISEEVTEPVFDLGQVASFGTMRNITGCGCIKDGHLERLMLTAEVGAALNTHVVIKAAGHGLIERSITPGTSETVVSGQFRAHLTPLIHLGIEGEAQFLHSEAEGFVEGELEGAFEVGTGYEFASLGAHGKLDWHLGDPDLWWLQGKLAVNMVEALKVLEGSGTGTSYAGALLIGVGVPKGDVWVINPDDLPTLSSLTGAYGYGSKGESIELWIVNGGYRVGLGLGLFVSESGKPIVLGRGDARIWGDILGGFVSASGSGELTLALPPPSYHGVVKLRGCVFLIGCRTAKVDVVIDSSGIAFD